MRSPASGRELAASAISSAKTLPVSQVRERQPHAILDFESRLLKARKIARLVERVHPLTGARVLDIGAGSGHIASTLGELVGKHGDVWAVDVRDQRRTIQGYGFKEVAGTDLPFEAGSFDVVLSNHVIEHVGGRADQLNHLREIRRVLARSGVCYLAVPNRWVLLEPHFRLPFLSWLPKGLRDPYVRAARRGSHYDCNLPTRGQAKGLFSESGFEHEEVTIPAMRALNEIESPSLAVRLLCAAPQPVLRSLLPLNPTMIFLLSN